VLKAELSEHRCAPRAMRSKTTARTNSTRLTIIPTSLFPWRGRWPHARVERAVALCGSGVGASVAANKFPGVRAGLIHDVFSAHQGVEDDDMNVLCLGGKGDRVRACLGTGRNLSTCSLQRSPSPPTSVGEGAST
jgi:hypothetical protein